MGYPPSARSESFATSHFASTSILRTRLRFELVPGQRYTLGVVREWFRDLTEATFLGVTTIEQLRIARSRSLESTVTKFLTPRTNDVTLRRGLEYNNCNGALMCPTLC